MWVKDSERHPAREDEYPVRRISKAASGEPFYADVCAWVPNPYTKRTHGAWYNIRRGGDQQKGRECGCD